MKIPAASHELKDLCASCLREECEGRDRYHMNASICSRHEPVTLDHIKALMVAMSRLRSSPAPVVGGVPEPTPEDIDAAWNDFATLNSGMLSDEPEADLEVFAAGYRAGASRLPALKPGEVVRWIPVEESLPDDGATVGFITRCTRDPFYHGRALGGRFSAGEFGGFSVPGLMVEASHWFPFPAIPEEARTQPTPTEKETDHG
jgi:hypothetical protein